MKSRISICMLLCLAILASGIAAAQDDLVVVTDKATYEAAVQAAAQAYCPPYGQAAVASETFGTKVKSGDSDVGLPLSSFAVPQALAAVFYWDIGSTPGLYDDKDVAYLKFGLGVPPQVQANSIRLTGWGVYPAGSYVNPGDADIGQSLVMPPGPLPSGGQTGFRYMDVTGGAGYDLGDPVYLKVGVGLIPVPTTGTNDIRITTNAGFPAGSRVSLNDPDAAKPLSLFMAVSPIGVFPTAPRAPIAQLAFYNANGNVNVGGFPIYDEGDIVYLDILPGAPLPIDPIVSPNDIRLF